MEGENLNNESTPNRPHNVLTSNLTGFNSDSADEFVDAPADPRPAGNESEPNRVFEEEKARPPHLEPDESEESIEKLEKGFRLFSY